MNIRYLGHSAFELSADGVVLLVDPFLTGNPRAAVRADEITADAILLSHGHGDHVGDAVAIARRSPAPIVAITELAKSLAADGVETRDPNLGGTARFEWGWVKLVPAWHTSTSPSGVVSTPAGLVIQFGGKLVYYLGDTCLFSDLALAAPRGQQVDAALVPIGGHYTMDADDAIQAVELIGPRIAIPCHYDTFPVIAANAAEWKRNVERATEALAVILAPGASYEV